VESWWKEIDDAVLHCLVEGNRAMAPAEIGRRLGLPESATQSILSMMAREGKIRICSVERQTPVMNGQESRPGHQEEGQA
jgi:hypothetical protein